MGVERDALDVMSWFEQLRREALHDAAPDGGGGDEHKWARHVLASSSPVSDVHVFATPRQASSVHTL